MTIGEICTKEVDVAEAHETVQAAAERMRSRAVGTLVVLDSEKKPVGIVTDRDLVVRAVASHRDPDGTHLDAIMTRCPRTVGESDSLEFALAAMRAERVRRLPVTGYGGELVGIVGLDDILIQLVNDLRDVEGLLRAQEPKESFR